MPFILYATRAVPTLKSGYSLVRKWNALPPEERDAVQEQGRRAIAAIMAVKAAATASRSVSDPPENWDAALEAARHPGPAEKMAKQIVEHLQAVSESTMGEIAGAVGAAGKDDTTLERAMRIAQSDGYIRRVGVNFRGIRWDTTEWADKQLLDSPHIRQLEQKIVAFAGNFGLVSLDHISGRLGLEDDAPELRGALERAVSDQSIEWYGNGIYGLPLDRLSGFVPEVDLWAETKPPREDRDIGGAIDELEAAVKDLAKAMKATGIHKRAPAAPDDGGGDAPYEALRQLQELHGAGALTDEEYAAKKAELLQRI
ncbi:MAG TPA: SHOCT domain-containing protein [Solirubrobacterales bacterium]|nr:SHOCT domain-containing protein [Solirubrobacterales bacterium]